MREFSAGIPYRLPEVRRSMCQNPHEQLEVILLSPACSPARAGRLAAAPSRRGGGGGCGDREPVRRGSGSANPRE